MIINKILFKYILINYYSMIDIKVIKNCNNIESIEIW